MTASVHARVFDLGCTVTVTNTAEDLSAHVELDGNPEIRPGDSVTVHGAAIAPTFGETIRVRRRAPVRRASPLKRLWVRLVGDLGIMELVD